MDIDSTNPSLNGSEEVEEAENNSSLNKIGEVQEPEKGMCFNSKQGVYSFYAKYAKHLRFVVAYRTQNIGQDGEVNYFGVECTRACKRTKRSEVHPLEPTLSSFIECKAKARATLQKDGRFKLTTVVLQHTHDLILSDSRHFAMNKRILTPTKRRIEINDEPWIRVARNFHSIVIEAGGYEALSFDEQDARNHIQSMRRLRLGVGDAESVALYFHRMQQQNSNFYYAIDLDEDGRMRNLFWADARSMATYKAFGDVVSFDTTYLTNKYDMPFAQFVGVNHHGQSILLGCGLLSNENTETFLWLFREWLSCMSDVPPKAIIIDQCRTMQNAIEVLFPEARHRWCLWHIMKKIPEKLRGYAQYESIKLALQNAVYDCFTKHEFDEEWQAMIGKFNLDDNDWLGVLYSERHGWIPVYVKDVFWAGMPTTQRSESMNAFFDGYVNSKTTLKQFFEQYDHALRSKVEKEMKADLKSRKKLYDCLTVYEFEKQFRVAYTNAKFKEVQVELKRLLYCRANLVKEEGAMCTYHVKEAVLVGEKMKTVEFVVYFNATECELHYKYIVSRWKKDIERGYTSIPTTYTKAGAVLNAKLHDKYHKMLDEIIEIAGNNDGKHEVLYLGLIEIKDRVRKDQSGSASHAPPSTSNVPHSHTSLRSPSARSTTKASMSHNMLSPMVARRRGRPCTKRKVSKVDAIVNRLKRKSKKPPKAQGHTVRQCQPRKLNFPGTDDMQYNTCHDPMGESDCWRRMVNLIANADKPIVMVQIKSMNVECSWLNVESIAESVFECMNAPDCLNAESICEYA
ncbi:protein FAR-RED IMPAIRED RESPONSE 1-like [Camellia sinensis]|uniref:protein FAR-RED IMPAIRED RESPONSE 1-like n=1 Tax=Camellia sinensis TaxID=4442 RepID=UPI0010367892|nr:protein FAR-RED IMPAIRED RESPONSE 1-like [Camellia sinensis]